MAVSSDHLTMRGRRADEEVTRGSGDPAPAATSASRSAAAGADVAGIDVGMVGAPTWRDRVVASDPGSVRLALAARAALSLAAALAVGDAVATSTGLPTLIMVILGAVLTMMVTFTASDPTTGGRVVTQLLLPVAMIAGITLSTLVDRHRVLSLVVFVVVMFAAVYVRRFGPRAFACGMVGWMGYFIALFLQLSLGSLPAVAAALVTATVLLLVITAVVAPPRPDRRLRRMVESFAARVRIAHHEHGEAQRGDGADRAGHDDRVTRALLRVNEAAVLVDGQLAVPRAVRDPAAAPSVRAAVLEVELALAVVLDTPVRAAGDGGGVDLAGPEGSAGRGSSGDARAGSAPAHAGAPVDEVRDRDLVAALERLDAVLLHDRSGVPPAEQQGLGDGCALHASRRRSAPAAPFVPGAELFGGFLPGSAVTVGGLVAPDDAPRTRLALTTRQALQVALAGGLAIVLGDLVSGQRWYWAVLACFLAFTGASTAAETVTKAAQRTVGTVVGVVLALAVVPLLGHGIAVVIPVILVVLFLGFYLFRVSYTSLAVAVTIIVAEMYEMLGTFSGGLLALRVGETALGAVIGAVVAVAFLPHPARDAEPAARARLAEDLRAALVDVSWVMGHGDAGVDARADGDAGARADGGEVPPDLHARLRALDAGVHQLALVATPLARRLAPGGSASRDVVRRRLAAWVVCAARVRGLVLAAERHARPAHDDVVATAADLHALADDLVSGTRTPRGSGDGTRRARPDDADAVGATPLLGELSALHGALVALHDVDPDAEARASVGHGAEPDTDAPAPSDAPAPPAASAGPAVPAGPARGVRIAGRVTDADGTPLVAVVTLVDTAGRQCGRARSTGDGGWSVSVPGPGTWQVVAAAPGHAPRADRLVVGERARDVVHDAVLALSSGPTPAGPTPSGPAASRPTARPAAAIEA